MAFVDRFKFHSQKDLEDAYKAISDAILTNSRPNNVSAGDFSISITPEMSLSRLLDEIGAALYKRDPEAHADLLRPNRQTIRVSPNLDL